MQQKTKDTLRIALGVFLILFGLAGMILPILPGWWVALFGLHLLGWRLVISKKKPWYQKFHLRRSHKKIW